MEKAFAVLVIAAILLGLTIVVTNAHEQQIKDKVASIGGDFTGCEIRLINHPFFVVAKGQQVYHFTYKLHGRDKEGWVRFGLFTDWKM